MAEQAYEMPLLRPKGGKEVAYSDIFMRKSLNDNGTLPVKNPGWTNSPDIIPNGVELIDNPVNYLTQNYSKDVGRDTVAHRQNYFYVRGMNLYNGGRSGDFYLYYSPQHLFLFPSLWRDNQMKTSSGTGHVSAKVPQKGQVVVPTEPFIYMPESSEHSCLISRVVTADNPNPLPDDFRDFDALAKYILDHPNMAWRNVSLVEKEIPTFTHKFAIDTGDESGVFLLGIRCHDITTGSRISFSCGTPIPDGPDMGKYISMPETSVVNPPDGLDPLYLLRMHLPAGFKTEVSYTYWAKTPIKPNWQVIFDAYYVINPGNELYERAYPLSYYGINANEVMNMEKDSSVASRTLILGSVQTTGV